MKGLKFSSEMII